ncbi:MAG: hypothetical protein V4447_04560 [Pseudomonadota bacterium]
MSGCLTGMHIPNKEWKDASKFADGGEAAQSAVTVAACEFEDASGGLVSAILNLDESDVPFEIDIWK